MYMCVYIGTSRSISVQVRYSCRSSFLTASIRYAYVYVCIHIYTYAAQIQHFCASQTQLPQQLPDGLYKV